MTTYPGREVDKDTRALIKHLIDKHGWRYRPPTRGGHPSVVPANPAAPIITFAMTPSDRRGMQNTVSRIRRHGGTLPSDYDTERKSA